MMKWIPLCQSAAEPEQVQAISECQLINTVVVTMY